jgi:exopolysaccharide biosynthesis polyprenyl glycosylphosphotransferase
MTRAKPYRSWLGSTRLAFLDIITLLVCGIMATELNGYTIVTSNVTFREGLLVIACFMGCLNIIGAYEINRDMSTLRYASEHALAMCAALAIVFVVTYGFSSYHESIKPGRSVLVLTLILATPLSLLYRYHFSVKEARSAAARVFYVVGTPELVSQLQIVCQKAKFGYPLRFVNVTTEMGRPTEMQEFESSRAGADNLSREVLFQKLRQCEGVIVNLSTGELDEELAELLLAVNLHSAPVYPVELFIETYFYKIDLAHVTLASALDGTFIADHQKAYGKLKSAVDGFLAAAFLLALLPLILLIALIIKLEDFGPVLFMQERIGRFEEPFLLYKFRTMSVRNEADPQLYTATSDSRITKIGYILRLMRLDELPQFWNVVKGEMSIIGPRAEWSKLVEQYEKKIPFYHLRHMVKPGITGWAQVNYGYGASLDDTLEKLQYDLYYIKHYSVHMDASIVLKTIFTMLSASGR